MQLKGFRLDIRNSRRWVIRLHYRGRLCICLSGFFFLNVGATLRDIYKKTPVLGSYLQSLSRAMGLNWEIFASWEPFLNVTPWKRGSTTAIQGLEAGDAVGDSLGNRPAQDGPPGQDCESVHA